MKTIMQTIKSGSSLLASAFRSNPALAVPSSKPLPFLARVALRSKQFALAFVAVALLGLAFAQSAKADYGIVSVDSSNNVTFSPGVLVSAIIVGIVAAIGAGAAIVVLWVGAKWLIHIIKGSK